MKRSILLAAALACTLPLLTACGHLSIGRAASVSTGYVSHQLCSAVFIAGLDPERNYHEAIEPLAGPFAFLMRYSVDREHAEVRATLAGMAESRAVHRPPFGCVNATGTAPSAAVAPPAVSASPELLAPIAGPEPVEAGDPALRLALARAFDESPRGPQRPLACRGACRCSGG